ncbi:hypothetical protein [Haloechinothrix halophila]|uniref:hypothetical protein n=1 Tax=Haloechinothrix halophila TaxID=1069073 RepID=UPI000400CF66|nr:hypothetical protein [Haloechinothrix halophila]
MRHDDQCDWPTDFEIYGHHLRSAEPYPDDCVMAIGINNDEPVTITADVVTRLRELRASVTAEQPVLTRRYEQKRLNASRQLLGDAPAWRCPRVTPSELAISPSGGELQ